MPRFEKGSEEAKQHMARIREMAKAKREALKNVSINEPIEEPKDEELIEFNQEPEEQEDDNEDIEIEIKPKTMRKPRVVKPKQEVQVIKAPPRPKKKIIIEEQEDEEEEVEIVYKPNKANSKSKTVKTPKASKVVEPKPFDNPLLTRRYSRI
jgi:hypothetical protein